MTLRPEVVPVDIARYVHGECQDDCQANASYQEGIILELECDEDKSICKA